MATQTPEITITVEAREGRGTGEAGRMRHQGRVPSVLYGGDKPPVAISVDEHAVGEILKGAAGENTIFLLKLKGTDEERLAMIKELQVDRISGKFIHIDFIRITRGHKLTVKMPVELVGDCVGVRHGGRVDFVSREIELEILPREMFDKFVLDITDLEVGEHLKVADLASQLPENAKFLDDENRVVCVVEIPRIVEEEVEEEVLEDEAVISEAAEPEIIGKGKGEDAEEGAGTE
ncbi:MAG: 50S ribosomal protein L25 [Acidobacteriota bacterium]|jgi:large subunit ribosomal protein L25|nr:50S ribosomal protein L25 [Acidobacteriota bacterium]